MNVNEEYEAAVTGFVAEPLHAPERNPFLADFVPFAQRVAHIGLSNHLSQIVIKTGSPGVPDFYQGAELWQWHLVDPDNHAPVGAQAWGDTALVLPDGLSGSYRNIFTGERVSWGTAGEVPVSQVLENFPVTLFVRANA